MLSPIAKLRVISSLNARPTGRARFLRAHGDDASARAPATLRKSSGHCRRPPHDDLGTVAIRPVSHQRRGVVRCTATGSLGSRERPARFVVRPARQSRTGHLRRQCGELANRAAADDYDEVPCLGA